MLASELASNDDDGNLFDALADASHDGMTPESALDKKQQMEPAGFDKAEGVQCHSWYFGNKMFIRDLFNVIVGTDRTVIKTRAMDKNGTLSLQHISP